MIFTIICSYANYNYSKILIANQIDQIDIKFSLIDALKGYNIDNKLNEKQKKNILKHIDIVNIIKQANKFHYLKKTIFSEKSIQLMDLMKNPPE